MKNEPTGSAILLNKEQKEQSTLSYLSKDLATAIYDYDMGSDTF